MNPSETEGVPEFPGFPDASPGSAGELLDDCRRTAARWTAAPAPAAVPVTLPGIRGTHVPVASLQVVAGMSEYGS